MKTETQTLIDCMKSKNPEHIQTWTKICLDQKSKYNKWAEKLKAEGVKMAHPDDGWVDRKEDKVHPCYPEFKHNPQIGDLIVLGNPDKYRFVRVVKIEIIGWSKMDYYYFEGVQ